MSTTWIRVAAAAVSTVAIVASAPMIASATEGHRTNASDDVSVSVNAKGSDHSDHSEDSDHSKDGQGGTHFTPAKNPNISVGIPAIAFTKDIVSTQGQLRTPVLINAAERSGTATLVRDGVPTSCSVQAQPGVVSWLTCSLNNREDTGGRGSDSQEKSRKANASKVTGHTYSVVVTTTNGLTATHAVTLD